MLCCRVLGQVKSWALSHAGVCVSERIQGFMWQRIQGVSCSMSHRIILKERTACKKHVLHSLVPTDRALANSLLFQRRTFFSATCFSAASTSTPQPGWYEGLADSPPIQLIQDLLTNVHQVTGLPWWATIMFTTVALRTSITIPLAVYQMYIIAKVENLQPEIAKLAKQLRYEVSVRAKQLEWSEKVTRFQFRKNLSRIVSELYVRDNCHPFKATLLIWVQLPLWICISIALRNLSVMASDAAAAPAIQSLASGGVLWFPDLTLPDSTWIMPIFLGLINLLIVEIFALRKMEKSKIQKYATYMIRSISVIMVPIAATVPSSMALYWLTSSWAGLGQNLLLRSPTIRALCRIPKMKSDSDTPFRDLSAEFITKYFVKK
ncbi:mitochondrial inner membrane protein COX18-like [Callorhinchus milii]|uniref:COX18 cytochrome c oxidase assembly-like protein n=1 Tax=Callorhinchus milii TaxID=7868 RepID=K4FUP1_CALMI|nr:mitochondrial inner membrane protein COX18-like [Callorhinchus milii]AFK11274.1 COX18 cytochrome c oxidase assembly-like protein [Callorhinchus milii]